MLPRPYPGDATFVNPMFSLAKQIFGFERGHRREHVLTSSDHRKWRPVRIDRAG